MRKGQGIEAGLVYITYLMLTTPNALIYYSVHEETAATRTNEELTPNLPNIKLDGLYGLPRPDYPAKDANPQAVLRAPAAPIPEHAHKSLSSGM